MARTEMKSLFTAITEEECATVSGGGLTIILLNFDLTQSTAQILENLRTSVPSSVDTSAGAIATIQQAVIKGDATSA